MKLLAALAASALALTALQARADITVGAVLSLTGPAAALGLPEGKTVELLPKTIAGQNVRYIVLDDGSDPTAALRGARKLIETERPDVILGPSTTPNALALIDAIAQAETPMITMAGCDACILPPGGARSWVFKPASAAKAMVDLISEDLKAKNGKSIAVIAFATAFGDSFGAAMETSAQAHGIQPLLNLKFNPTDTSVTPQVLRVIAARPDAVFIAASGTPSALPIIELRSRGYTGQIYGNQGMASADVLRLGGKAMEGWTFPVHPVLVASQLPDGNPIKPVALKYVEMYENRFGPGSLSLTGASMWDSFLLTANAAEAALKGGQPGTPEFRRALREALEKTHELVATEGVYTMTPMDHSGTDQRALVLVTVKNGTWSLVK